MQHLGDDVASAEHNNSADPVSPHTPAPRYKYRSFSLVSLFKTGIFIAKQKNKNLNNIGVHSFFPFLLNVAFKLQFDSIWQ